MHYDVAFCDTCIGGSTVAANLARPGLRAFYLADYAVNPLGTRSDKDVHAALLRWLVIAAQHAPITVIACNTASARLEGAEDLRQKARELDVELRSMVDLLDITLASEDLAGKRVCLMGTSYTVSSAAYVERLNRAGAQEVIRLGATQTERSIAHLRHTTDEGRATILEEIGDSIRGCDAVVLACTCFPLIGELIQSHEPAARLIDPGLDVKIIADWPIRTGPSHLTLAYSDNKISRAELQSQAGQLFPGWDEIEIVSLAD